MPESAELPFGSDAPLTPLMRTTRTMRRLRPDPVPRGVLVRLVEAATWAPSGGNHQQYAWVVVTDRGVMAELATLWRQSHDLYLATMSFRPQTMDASQYGRFLDALRFQRDHFHETPAVMVACYDLGAVRAAAEQGASGHISGASQVGARKAAGGTASLNRATAMAEAASVYPGVQNLLLRARAEGLAAALTTWHLLLEPDFKRVLRIPRHVKTFALIPIGYPRGKFGGVTRRSAEEVIHWQGWQDDAPHDR